MSAVLARAAVIQMPRPIEEQPSVDQFKLVLMRSLSARILAKYKTMYAASIELDIEADRLSRMRTGKHELFSLSWLIELGERLEMRMTLTID